MSGTAVDRAGEQKQADVAAAGKMADAGRLQPGDVEESRSAQDQHLEEEALAGADRQVLRRYP
jgi:hypothetical protein